MKLREQASLYCKILALLCVVLALNSLQQTVPQAVSLAAMRGVSGQPTLLTFISMIAPATLMFLFAAALWGVSPFVAALMVPNEIVEKADEGVPTAAAVFGARDALRIALMVLGLWLVFRGAVSCGEVVALNAMAEGIKTTQDKVAVNLYLQQTHWMLMGAVMEFAFGVLLLILSRPISRRAFPN